MRKQLPHRDGVSEVLALHTHQRTNQLIRQVAHHRAVQRDPAFLHQLQHEHRHEGLGHTGRFVAVPCRTGLITLAHASQRSVEAVVLAIPEVELEIVPLVSTGRLHP
jgi:hypothetical protein